MKLGWRLWLLIIALLLSILAIRPTFETGALIKSVDRDSQAFEQGLKSGEVIKFINNVEVKDTQDYAREIQKIFPTQQEIRVDIVTDKGEYVLYTNQSPQITTTNVPRTSIRTGLDIQGGARALVKPEGNITSEQLDDLVAVSSNRFNVFGL